MGQPGANLFFCCLSLSPLLVHAAEGDQLWHAQVTDVQRQRHGGVWFPHDLLGDLLARLGFIASPGAARLHAQLGEALQAHYSTAMQQSGILEQRAMAVG